MTRRQTEEVTASGRVEDGDDGDSDGGHMAQSTDKAGQKEEKEEEEEEEEDVQGGMMMMWLWKPFRCLAGLAEP